MKKTTAFLLGMLLAVCLTGCYSVKIAAPMDKNVQLASPYEPLPIKHKVTNWYAFFGALPISKNNSTDYVIHNLNLEKVRVTTKIGVGNYLLNILLNVVFPTTLVTTTTIIEGSARPQASAQPMDR